MKNQVKFYCECCSKHQPVEIGPLRTDVLNKPLIWADIVCVECRFVIATISADEPGDYRFVRIEGEA